MSDLIQLCEEQFNVRAIVSFLDAEAKAVHGGSERTQIELVARLIRAQAAEIERLQQLINTPHTHDFIEAVRLEMPHQRERWGSQHDAGKDDTDWVFLVGFLLGKAAQARKSSNLDKATHHTITAAAACGNYFLQIVGESTSMRPGIAPPEHQPTAAPRP